jgi:hypothetical protein
MSGIGPQALSNSECCLGIKAVLDGKDPNALNRLQNKTFIPESKVPYCIITVEREAQRNEKRNN